MISFILMVAIVAISVLVSDWLGGRTGERLADEHVAGRSGLGVLASALGWLLLAVLAMAALAALGASL